MQLSLTTSFLLWSNIQYNNLTEKSSDVLVYVFVYFFVIHHPRSDAIVMRIVC